MLIYFGGPTDIGRGFVLHSDDFTNPGTVPLGNHIALTATVDVLQSIAEGNGPRDCLLAMGYVGWGPGQLDSELHSNRWLQAEADSDTLFHVPIEKRWEKAIAKFGVTPEVPSSCWLFLRKRVIFPLFRQTDSVSLQFHQRWKDPL